MDLLGFEFVEFVSQEPGMLERFFDALGFVKVARHRKKDAALYRQGGINLVVNNEAGTDASWFGTEHGIGLRVKDARAAHMHALELGAVPLELHTGSLGTGLPALQGIGGGPLYLFDAVETGESIYDIDFEFIPGVARCPAGYGLTAIDHVGHAVYGGRLSYWAALYGSLFDSRAIRCFDIEAPFRGEGIKHIALAAGNLDGTVRRLHAAGVPLTTTPMTSSCRLPDVCFEFVQGASDISSDRARMCAL
jgi:4-hydroxyphenylpyruvate dioxygenase